MQAFVIKQPGRRCLGQDGHGFQQALIVRVVDEAAYRRGNQAGNCQQSTANLPESRAIEYFRMERVHFRLVAHENPAKLRRGHLVGEIRRHKRSAIYTNINIDVVEIETIKCLIQRPERSDFINAAQRTTATKGKPDAGSGFMVNWRAHSLPFSGLRMRVLQADRRIIPVSR